MVFDVIDGFICGDDHDDDHHDQYLVVVGRGDWVSGSLCVFGQERRNVPMFNTSIKLRSAGPFQGQMSQRFWWSTCILRLFFWVMLMFLYLLLNFSYVSVKTLCGNWPLAKHSIWITWRHQNPSTPSNPCIEWTKSKAPRGINMQKLSTSLPCAGHMVVSMRPYKQEDMQKVSDITGEFPAAHGTLASTSAFLMLTGGTHKRRPLLQVDPWHRSVAQILYCLCLWRWGLLYV